MPNPIAKIIWDTYEEWDKAQMYLGLYQQHTLCVEDHLKIFTEEQRAIFTKLVALADSGTKETKKDGGDKTYDGTPQ